MSSLADQLTLIEKLQVFKVQGRDNLGRKVLRIVGKFLPAKLVDPEALNKYLEDKIIPELDEKPFSAVYFHTNVSIFPGISVFQTIYEAFPTNVRENLEAIKFVHPGIQARLFLATFGRFILSRELYRKMNYVSRLDFLWDHVRRTEIVVPEFVTDHDMELEYRPLMMDYDDPLAFSVAGYVPLPPLCSMRDHPVNNAVYKVLKVSL